MIVVKSKGMMANPYLQELLVLPIEEDFSSNTKYCAVWGLGKDSSFKVEKEANKLGIPIIRLEDGLVRSYSLNEPSYSLYKTHTNIYYDAKSNSNIEVLLNSKWKPSQDEIKRYGMCLEMMQKYNISKYNDGLDFKEEYFKNKDKKRVLLIDQTYGDKSIEYGLADENSFKEMLAFAIKDIDNQEIYVKVHPEVVAGKKKGYLNQEISKYELDIIKKIHIISENYNAPSMMDYFDEIHVVTSQVGFDALLRNKIVHCFGVPFYSNWGLTIDHKKTDKRTVKRELHDIFIAIMFKNTSYINPFNGAIGKLEDLLEYIALQKRHRNKEDIIFFKTKLWKRRGLEKFLKSKKTKFLWDEIPDKEKNKFFVAWGYEKYNTIPDDINEKACIEDGFIRSVGLGSDFEDPLSLVIDYGGIYFNPTSNSDLLKILNEEHFTQYEKLKGDEVLELLREKKVTKYNVGIKSEELSNLKKNNPTKKIILVPGQVEDDASIKYGARNIKTNYDLLDAVCQNNTGSVIIYKPHPDVLSGNRIGGEPKNEIEKLQKKYKENIFHIEKEANILECFDVSDEVHVITSTSGLEAIIRGKKVVTYGLPFYGGYGLTEDKEIYPQKRRRLSVNELILGCYLLYPRYMISPGYFTNAISAINHISLFGNKKQRTEKTWLSQTKRKIKVCIKIVQALV